MPREVILLCQDLLFTTKVTGTGQAVGATVRVAPSLDRVKQLAGDTTNLVIIDLSSPPNTSADELKELRSSLAPSIQLMAYGSHVEVDKLAAAHAAGCDPVMARSSFVQQLPAILRGDSTAV